MGAAAGKIELLDCTLRDGAYIVDGNFGGPAIRGIVNKLQEANVDIIECGWLKDGEYTGGSSYYHVPSDLAQYISAKSSHALYVAMIDWDRYDIGNLPECDGKSIDAIRVVFPHGKHREGIAVGEKIQRKGYQVFFQAANTLAYSDEDLIALAEEANRVKPEGVSVVDTFGAMYEEDLERIISVLDRHLAPEIRLGLHSHNNQQLSFALTMYFLRFFETRERKVTVDASLCGMGRGAGNATTELVANYLCKKYHGNYDMNVMMDAIDSYMQYFQETYTWGYSTPYFISGNYCCHVNNIAYLMKNHRTNAVDMRNIIESLSPADRQRYDYDLLERKYMENQNRMIDDEMAMGSLREEVKGKPVLLIAPGRTTVTEEQKIKEFIETEHPVVIGVNAMNPRYQFDFLFLINATRYDYAQTAYPEQFQNTRKILLSNIKTVAEGDELIINFNRVVKRGWPHFDNAVINCLRLMDKLHAEHIYIAGFDGFKHKYNETYADSLLPTLNPEGDWDALNSEIQDMYCDYRRTTESTVQIDFLTDSIFDVDTVVRQ